MTTTIALAGKGGTGKTTVAALLIRYLIETGEEPILAIDADPSSNLHLVLGLDIERTVGDIREEMRAITESKATTVAAMPGGMSKHEYLDYQVQLSLAEGPQIDLLAMGRPEGPGCYCAANQMLRVILDQVTERYPYVVVDNEAGMEHLSRRTTRDVGPLLLVTDPTQRGLLAAERMAAMVPALEIGVEHVYLIVNRVRGDLAPPLAEAIEANGLSLIGTVPEDETMAEFEFSGRPLIELPASTPVYRAISDIADRILNT